jgi:aryl-alcohol dehydrogenase-like predicted oxidoreductase
MPRQLVSRLVKLSPACAARVRACSMADDAAAPAAKKPRTGGGQGKAAAQAEPPAPASGAGGAGAAAEPAHGVTLGGTLVSCVGLGTLPAGVAYPAPALRPSAAAFRGVLQAAAAAAALPLFVDCADTYCEPCTNTHALERELAAAAAALPDLTLVLGTKSGMARVNSESNGWRPSARGCTPGGVRDAILAARAAMCAPGAPLFLWSLHHCDSLGAPGSLEACLAAAAQCVAEGALLHVGLCNATVPLLRRALASGVPVVCVQNEWSPYQREAEKALPAGAAASSKKGVLPFCAERGIVFVGYAPLGGLKARRAERSLARDHPGFASLAAKHGCSAHAACLAALLHRGRALGARVLLIPGARTAAHAADSCAAAALTLTDAEVRAVLPPV